MQNGNGVKDRYELALTTESQQAADHYVDALDMFIAQTYGVEQEFERAVESDEGLAVAHAALGLLQLYRSAPDEAKKSVAHAKSLAVHATKRERQQVEAIGLMVNGRNDKAYRLIQEHLKEFPRDILMVRLASRVLILGCSGAGVANFPEELLAMVKPLASDYGDDWAFLGQYAFAHHETGQFSDALTYAERSLEQRPDNANASHSVAHVFFETGDPDGGSDFLGDWLEGYDRRGPFNVHLSWHQALFQLATGRPENAVSLYEGHIRPTVIKKNFGSLQDAASLMWRMKIYGDGEPGPWNEVLEIARPAAENPGTRIQGCSRGAGVRGGRTHGGDGQADIRAGCDGRRGQPVVERGNAASCEGHRGVRERAYDDAADNLDGLVDQLPRIGGSHAQREVFEDTILESYIRSGRFDKAQDLLHTRLKRRTSVRDEVWLGRTMGVAAD